eukprot:GEMP01015728.1.p1 GENE.GEMP01015728.1~~GEMP01015728.1.p1  ORF type:complete len:371 (+),score=93.27 GEMP01015728.1:54-1115(+)
MIGPTTIVEEIACVPTKVLEDDTEENRRPCSKFPKTPIERYQHVLENRQQRSDGNRPFCPKSGRKLRSNAVGITSVYRAVLGEDAFGGAMPQTVGALKIGELTRISGQEVLIVLVEDPIHEGDKQPEGNAASVVHSHPGYYTPLSPGSVVYFIVRGTNRTATGHQWMQGEQLLEFIVERLMRQAEAAENTDLPWVDAGDSTCRKVDLEYEYLPWPVIRNADGSLLNATVHLGPLSDRLEGEYAMNCRANFKINPAGFVTPETALEETFYAEMTRLQTMDRHIELIDDDVHWVPGRYFAVRPGSWAIFVMRPIGKFDDEGEPESSESLLDGVHEEMDRIGRTPADENFLRTAQN